MRAATNAIRPVRYWYYVNHVPGGRAADGKRTRYARLHVTTCRWCNDGKGIRATRNEDENAWHGRFRDEHEAREHFKILPTRLPHPYAWWVCDCCTRAGNGGVGSR